MKNVVLAEDVGLPCRFDNAADVAVFTLGHFHRGSREGPVPMLRGV